MTDRYELASAIFGTKRAETDPSALSTAIITGTAVEDSESGMVRIIPDGNVIAPEGEDNSIVLPTSPNVKSGDNVIIISTGGTATTPIVAGASGSGDRVQSAADAASQAASQVQQEIADFKSGADVDYAIYEYVDDEVGELSTTVSATYLSKTEAQTTYATQSQLTQTAESITQSVSQTYATKYEAADGNLIEESALVDGYILNTGELSPSDAAKEWTTEFIAVTPGQALSYSVYLDETPTRSWRMWIAYCFYDSQQAMVGSRMAKYGTTNVDLELSYPTITVPEGAAYIRCSWRYYDAASHAVLVQDVAATYATKSELTVGLEGIELEVSQTYATKDEAATTGEGSGESVTVDNGARLRSLEVYGKSVQDGTPTPSNPVPIQTVGGVNLLDTDAEEHTGEAWTRGTARDLDGRGIWAGITRNGYFNDWKITGSYAYSHGDGSVQMVGSGGGYGVGVEFPVKPNTTYTLTFSCTDPAATSGIGYYGSDKVNVSNSDFGTLRTKTFTTPADAAYAMIVFVGNNGIDTTFSDIMLVEGSTAQDYLPYGTIGIAVRDSGDSLISLTPIPLDGNVLASLPDGTCDVLTVDESGNVTLTKRVGAERFGSTGSYSGGAVGTGGWGGSTTKGFYRYQPAIAQGNAYAPVGLSDSFSKFGSIYGNESVGFMIANTPANANQRYIGFRLPVSQLADYGYDDSSAASNIAALRAWLADGNDFRVLYQLAGPSTVGLGRISMPALSDSCTVSVIASLTPTIDAGWYTGNGSAIYAQSTRITQTEQDVTTAITGVEGLQTMVRQYGNGVLVCRTGNSVGALVNADGSFDVVSVTWSGGVPTDGTVLGRYAASGIYLGNPSDSTKPYMALDADSLDLFWSNMPILHLGINETTNTPYILSGYNPSFSASDFGGASATFGEYCRASATDSFAAGHLCQVNSGANNSAAIGNNLRVIAANQVVVGCYNDATVLGDARFVVGNGYNGSPSNAFAVWDDGSIKYKAPSTRFGETSGADIAITRTYTANGFAIENAVFHATADMAVMPVQFTATSNVALSAQKVATIPAAYAPAENARCAIWCSPSWSGSDFTCGYVDVNPSGEVSVTAPSAKYWFGQVVWIRS